MQSEQDFGNSKINKCVSELIAYNPISGLSLTDSVNKNLNLKIEAYAETVSIDIRNFPDTQNLERDKKNFYIFAKRISSIISKNVPKNIIFSISPEENINENFCYFLCESLIKELENISYSNFCIVLNINIDPVTEDKIFIKKLLQLPNVVQIPFFVSSTLIWYKKLGRHTKWDPTNESYLFLPGKLYKLHRLPALYEFLKSDIAGHLKYSCAANPVWFNTDDINHYYQEIANVMNVVFNGGWNDNNIKELINNINNCLDGIPGQKRYIGVYSVPEELYNNTFLEIVSETYFQNRYHITEKSLRSIVLGYPFIQICKIHNITLSELGFRIFEDLLDNNSSIHKCDAHGQILDVIQNCKKLKKIDPKIIKDTINYNTKMVNQIYTDSVYKIQKYIPKFEDWHDQWFLRFLNYPKDAAANFASMNKLTLFT